MSREHKTENFFSSHVRLITFLVTVAVFLVFFIPLAIPGIKEYWGQYADMRDPLTLDRLVVLSEQSAISKKQISEYKSRTDDAEYETYYYFDIEPYYTVIAVVNKESDLVIYCKLLNEETGETVNVLDEDLRAYLNKTQNQS